MEDEDRREQARLYGIQYRASEAGKVARQRYLQSDKGRANIQRKNHSEAAKEAAARYHASEKYLARRAAKIVSGESASYEAEYRRKARALHPERTKARAAMNWGVRSGYLIRPTVCSVCQRERPIEGHHHLGYAPEHWFDVAWLCRPCHRGIHRREAD